MNIVALRIAAYLNPLFLIGPAVFATHLFGQIYHVKEMNTEQIKALDRDKTVVLLPGGILEEHGPYLPSFTDGYRNERLTEALANAIVERPGWKVLSFLLFPWALAQPTPLARSTCSPALTPCARQPYGLSLWTWRLT
jgi:hypothetical protein